MIAAHVYGPKAFTRVTATRARVGALGPEPFRVRWVLSIKRAWLRQARRHGASPRGSRAALRAAHSAHGAYGTVCLVGGQGPSGLALRAYLEAPSGPLGMRRASLREALQPMGLRPMGTRAQGPSGPVPS